MSTKHVVDIENYGGCHYLSDTSSLDSKVQLIN